MSWKCEGQPVWVNRYPDILAKKKKRKTEKTVSMTNLLMGDIEGDNKGVT